MAWNDIKLTNPFGLEDVNVFKNMAWNEKTMEERQEVEQVLRAKKRTE